MEVNGDSTSVSIFAGFNIANRGIVYGAEIDYDSTEYEIADGAQEVDPTTRLKGRIGTELGGGLAYGVAGLVAATSPGLGDDNGHLLASVTTFRSRTTSLSVVNCCSMNPTTTTTLAQTLA